MQPTLEKFCAVLDQELERQELVYTLVKGQHEALCLRDRKALEARTDALSVLLRESRDAEEERHALFDAMADDYGLPPQARTLTNLIAVCPESYADRLRALQKALRALLNASQEQTRTNARQVRRSIQAVSDSLAAAQPALATAHPAYSQPRAAGLHKAVPVFMDQRG